MSNGNNDQIMDVLDGAIASLHKSSVASGPSPDLVAATAERLRSLDLSPDNVRPIKREKLMLRVVRYSGLAAAVTSLAFLVGSLWVVNHSSSTAFADVIEKVQKANSVTCVAKQRHGSGPEKEDKILILGNVVRQEKADGAILILDMSQRKALHLNTTRKVVMEHDLAGAVPVGEDPIAQLRNLTQESAERIADEQLDERNCHVYVVKDATVMGIRADWKIWIDPGTALPVKMHIGDSDQSFTFEEFRWNEPLDRKLFNLEIPEGYTITKIPTGQIETASPRKPSSGDVVRGTAVAAPGRVDFAFHEWNPAAKTLSVRIRGTGLVIDGFRLAEDAQIVSLTNFGTQRRTIHELNKDLYDEGHGVPVTLDLAADGTATKLESRWYDLGGVLKSVDASKQTITLTYYRPVKKDTVETIIPVLSDARVVVDGKESKLDSLKPGMAMVTQLTTVKGGSRAVGRIEATSLEIAGKVDAVDASMSTISIRGANFAIRGLPVAREARILIDGKESAIQDLKVGMNIRLQLEANSERALAIGAQVGKDGELLRE